MEGFLANLKIFSLFIVMISVFSTLGERFLKKNAVIAFLETLCLLRMNTGNPIYVPDV